MNPTRDEVNAILAQYEDALMITPAQLLELAKMSGIEPNFAHEYEPSPEALAATPALPKALDRYLSTGDVRQMRNDYEHAQMLHDWRNRNDWREIARDHWQDALAFAVFLLADATRTVWHKAFWFGFGVTVVVCLVLILGGAR